MKYLSQFWRNLEVSLINCETNIKGTWSECINSSEAVAIFQGTNPKVLVTVVTSFTEDKEKLLQILKVVLGLSIN